MREKMQVKVKSDFFPDEGELEKVERTGNDIKIYRKET